MSQRDRKKNCLAKIKKYFGDDSLHRFLIQKYEGHNASGNWWKEIGSGIDHICVNLGLQKVPRPYTVKKAFSDALFEDARSGKNLELILSGRHIQWIKRHQDPGSISLADYAEYGYHIGADGVIEKMPVTLKRKRQSSPRSASGEGRGTDSVLDASHSDSGTTDDEIIYQSGYQHSDTRHSTFSSGNAVQEDHLAELQHRTVDHFHNDPFANIEQVGDDTNQPPETDHSDESTTLAFLEDTRRVADITDPTSFTDSKLTCLLPSFMAIDIRGLQDIETLVPIEVREDLARTNPLTQFSIPVGLIYGRAGVRVGLNIITQLSGKIVYIFYRRPTIDSPAHAFFGLRGDQAISQRELAQYPIAWFSEASQCATEGGRKIYLNNFRQSCDRLEQLSSTISRDRTHIKVIAARHAQLHLCEIEWAAGHSNIFRPTFLGDSHINAASDWVDEQMRREILSNNCMVDANSVSRGREQWFFTREREDYIPMARFRGQDFVMEEFMERVDRLVIPYVNDPEISDFVIRGTLQWLHNAKLLGNEPNSYFGNPTAGEVTLCLKLFASAIVYVAARQNQRSQEVFNALYLATDEEWAKQSFYCAQLADMWTSECQGVLSTLIPQVARSNNNIDNIPLNEALSMNKDTASVAKEKIRLVTGSLFVTDVPPELSRGQLFCTHNLDELSERIVSALSNQFDDRYFILKFQECIPSWQHGYFDCSRSVYRQLPGYVGNEHLVWPELRGAQLKDAVIADLKKRIRENEALLQQGLAKLKAPVVKDET